MGKIKLLDKNLINQIAAGEVIERPVSVVKELVENSIDAGATKISVDISNDVRNIRVADNGSGIEKDDIELAFCRHATGKISTQEDLWNINTLGFRGEALASIISVSKLSCTTKTQDAKSGIKATCENSEVNYTEIGCANGTIMEVKDLFYNIPVRLKFMKNQKTELGHIQDFVQSIAISHPEIAFSLKNNNNELLKTTGSNDLEIVLGEVYNKGIAKELNIIDAIDEGSNMTLSGVVSNPTFTKSNRKSIFIFVNGRIVKCPIIYKSIDNAYSDLIPNGKYPFAVLALTLPFSDIDVNVHPQKREVRYKDTNLVYNFIFYSIKNALASFKKQEDQPNVHEINIEKQNNFTLQEEVKQISLESDNHSNNYSHTQKIEYKFQPDFVSETKYKPSFVQTQFVKTETSNEQKKSNIIGQYKNTYILIENENSLEIVDLNIAHESFLYEQLKESLKNKNEIVSQLFFTSEEIELSNEEIVIIENNKQLLEKMGYKIEINNNIASLKQVPHIVAQNNAENIIQDLLECLDTNFEQTEDKILMMSACKSAVKANQQLSLYQMQTIIDNWRTTKLPQTCPHGRPISHIIEHKELASWFFRNK